MSVEAVQTALGTEHAALWTYGLVSAFLGNQAAAVAEGANAHRARRDTTERWLRTTARRRTRPPPPICRPRRCRTGRPRSPRWSPSSRTPAPPGVACWNGPTTPALRTTALEALTTAAVRATRWRKTAGTTPASIALPGVASG